jgi:hypothetical protein
MNINAYIHTLDDDNDGDGDDNVYLIENYNMAVSYKIYLHTEPTRTA